MNKKVSLLVGALLLSLLSTAVLAVMYVTRQVEFQASIIVSGDFQIFEDVECSIALVSFDFGELDNRDSSGLGEKLVYFKNVGNQPIEIVWQLIDDNMNWVCATNGAYYLSPEASTWDWLLKADFDGIVWMPKDATNGEQTGVSEYGLVLAVGEVKSALVTLCAHSSPTAFDPPTVDFIIQFTAYDQYPEEATIL